MSRTTDFANLQPIQVVETDASGYVVSNTQPNFEVYIASGTTTPTMTSGAWNTTVSFNSSFRNQGNHFNASNNRFTAPVSGLYKFTVQWLVYKGTGSRTDLGFFKNDVWYSGHEIQGMNTHAYNNSFEISDDIYLNAGDYIEPKLQPHATGCYIYTASASDKFNRFSGYLIG